MNDTEPKEFYTSEELRFWLGLGRTKVYELLNTPPSEGGIPHFRIGRRIIIRGRDVEDWLERPGTALSARFGSRIDLTDR